MNDTLVLESRGGPLPDLALDASLPSALLVSRAAAELASAGLASELGITAVSDYGEMPIPILCLVGSERWAPYIEAEEWSEAALKRLLTWLAVVRTTSYGDVNVQVYSRDPLSRTMSLALQNTPLARLQLQGFLQCRPGDFSANGRLLLGLLDQFFSMRLKAKPATLETLDAFIDEQFGSEAPLAAMGTTVHLIGSLTGEILRMELRGRWAQTQQPGFESGWALELPGATVNPLGKAEKRFLNGREDSLAHFYMTIRTVLARK